MQMCDGDEDGLHGGEGLRSLPRREHRRRTLGRQAVATIKHLSSWYPDADGIYREALLLTYHNERQKTRASFGVAPPGDILTADLIPRFLHPVLAKVAVQTIALYNYVQIHKLDADKVLVWHHDNPGIIPMLWLGHTRTFNIG